MFGIKSSGCFIMGIVTGFILALIAGTVCICYFNPSIKEKTLGQLEAYWKNIKTGVDNSLDAAKRAPTAEPVIPQLPQSKVKAVPGNNGTAPASSQAPAAPSEKRPLIEIKLGI